MKSVIAHGILALGGLFLAYSVWSGEEQEAPPEGIEIIECDVDDLSQVALRSERRDIVIERQTEDGETSIWVSIERRPEEGDPETRSFFGNETAVELLGRFAPFRVIRSLGEVDEETLDDIEINDESSHLEVSCGGEEVEYLVGASTFGTPHRYLQGADGGDVYLVDSTLIAEVEGAEARLMQRELFRTEMTEVGFAQVSAFEQEIKLKQRNRVDPQAAEWVDASDPDRRNELYGNWLDLFRQMTVRSYLPRDGRPGSDLEDVSAAPVEVLTVTLLDEDEEQLDRLELVRVDADSPEYYARTNATGSWVKVPASVAQRVEDDVRPVVGLEPIERPAPEEEEETVTDPTVDGGVPEEASEPAPPTPTPPPSPQLPPGHP